METHSMIPSSAAPTTRSRSPYSMTLTALLIAIMAFNQFMIGNAAKAMGGNHVMQGAMQLFTPQAASAQTIIMPLLNEDGLTTHLGSMPTISDIPGEPKNGTVVEKAMRVMIATGAPFYAPDGINFDDAVGALPAWGAHERDPLNAPEEARYKQLTEAFPCNFCCGSPNDVAVNARCGCAHAKAARGFFRYMLATYGDEYSNDELLGEAYRWQAIWYPSGVVEDYLLATDRVSEIGHKPHGGAGVDGMHGMNAR